MSCNSDCDINVSGSRTGHRETPRHGEELGGRSAARRALPSRSLSRCVSAARTSSETSATNSTRVISTSDAARRVVHGAARGLPPASGARTNGQGNRRPISCSAPARPRGSSRLKRVINPDDRCQPAPEAGLGQGKQQAGRDEEVAYGIEFHPTGTEQQREVAGLGIELVEGN